MINRNPWPHADVLAILFVCAFVVPPQMWAQQAGQSPPPNTPQTQTTPAGNPATVQSQSAPDPVVPKNDRILWTLPNYLTVENASSLPPLSTKQKFKLVAEGTFDPIEFAFIGMVAGVDQASNTNPTFGQGMRGYAKRYGLAFTDNTVENFMAGAVFPSAFRQDPRYYQLGKGSFLHRAGYAAMRVVVTRSDSGKSEFNFSEFLGSGSAAAISNAYHPGPRTIGSNMSVWATQIGWDAVGFEMKEFWPDIHRFLTRGHHKT